MIVSDRGKVIRLPVRDIRVIGRNTQGVRLIQLEPGEKVSGVCRLMENDEDTNGENGETNGEEAGVTAVETTSEPGPEEGDRE
jgi:DNA gyrase subunit A